MALSDTDTSPNTGGGQRSMQGSAWQSSIPEPASGQLYCAQVNFKASVLTPSAVAVSQVNGCSFWNAPLPPKGKPNPVGFQRARPNILSDEVSRQPDSWISLCDLPTMPTYADDRLRSRSNESQTRVPMMQMYIGDDTFEEDLTMVPGAWPPSFSKASGKSMAAAAVAVPSKASESVSSGHVLHGGSLASFFRPGTLPIDHQYQVPMHQQHCYQNSLHQKGGSETTNELQQQQPQQRQQLQQQHRDHQQAPGVLSRIGSGWANFFNVLPSPSLHQDVDELNPMSRQREPAFENKRQMMSDCRPHTGSQSGGISNQNANHAAEEESVVSDAPTITPRNASTLAQFMASSNNSPSTQFHLHQGTGSVEAMQQYADARPGIRQASSGSTLGVGGKGWTGCSTISLDSFDEERVRRVVYGIRLVVVVMNVSRAMFTTFVTVYTSVHHFSILPEKLNASKFLVVSIVLGVVDLIITAVRSVPRSWLTRSKVFAQVAPHPWLHGGHAAIRRLPVCGIATGWGLIVDILPIMANVLLKVFQICLGEALQSAKDLKMVKPELLYPASFADPSIQIALLLVSIAGIALWHSCANCMVPNAHGKAATLATLVFLKLSLFLFDYGVLLYFAYHVVAQLGYELFQLKELSTKILISFLLWAPVSNLVANAPLNYLVHLSFLKFKERSLPVRIVISPPTGMDRKVELHNGLRRNAYHLAFRSRLVILAAVTSVYATGALIGLLAIQYPNLLRAFENRHDRGVICIVLANLVLSYVAGSLFAIYRLLKAIFGGCQYRNTDESDDYESDYEYAEAECAEPAMPMSSALGRSVIVSALDLNASPTRIILA